MGKNFFHASHQGRRHRDQPDKRHSRVRYDRDQQGIQESWTHYLPVQESSFKEELVFVLNSINDYLIVFFRGQVLIALCNAVFLTIGFVSMGLNYAVLFGVAAGVFGIVPYLGTIVTIV